MLVTWSKKFPSCGVYIQRKERVGWDFLVFEPYKHVHIHVDKIKFLSHGAWEYCMEVCPNMAKGV